MTCLQQKDNLWAITKVVLPFISLSIPSCTMRSVRVSIELVASSRISTGGSATAAGKIRYDGINVNKIKKDDLRRSLGIVLQDTHLFTGTVMENIRYRKSTSGVSSSILKIRSAPAIAMTIELNC